MNWGARQDDSSVYDETFVFGSFQLISAQRLLLDDGKPLGPGRALNILITLLEGAGETIHKDRLIAPGAGRVYLIPSFAATASSASGITDILPACSKLPDENWTLDG